MKIISSLILCVALTGCATAEQLLKVNKEEVTISRETATGKVLKSLPKAKRKIVLSVYRFDDLTGQHKPNDSMSEYSKAVTQGGLPLLTNALMKAGNHKWFTVVERGGLNNLLQERKLIRAMRGTYDLPSGKKLNKIGPLLYAGILLEGGITSYETNVLTGGLGARYLGIGGSTQYRRDVVTTHLRAVSVQSGEVLLSVDTSKTIYSAGVSSNVFKYVAFDKLLEFDAGFSVNEPPQLAVQQSIEASVYALIIEGKIRGLWDFADAEKGKKMVKEYLARRDGIPLTDDEKVAKVEGLKKKKISQVPSRSVVPVVSAVTAKKVSVVAPKSGVEKPLVVKQDVVFDSVDEQKVTVVEEVAVAEKSEAEKVAEEMAESAAPTAEGGDTLEVVEDKILQEEKAAKKAAENDPKPVVIEEKMDTDLKSESDIISKKEVEDKAKGQVKKEAVKQDKSANKVDNFLENLTQKVDGWADYASESEGNIDPRKAKQLLPALDKALATLRSIQSKTHLLSVAQIKRVDEVIEKLEKTISGLGSFTYTEKLARL